MEWTQDQDRALRAASRWLQQPYSSRPVFLLHGLAGTGKTTVAREIARQARNPLFLAPTGKAALVLRGKGCEGARTIHSAIYRPSPHSRKRLLEMQEELSKNPEPCRLVELRRLVREEEQRLARPGFALSVPEDMSSTTDLIVLDECSMVDARVAQDLVGIGCPILALGDPGQLPPVGGSPAWAREPDAHLGQVTRQAEGSEIIRLARHVRQRGSARGWTGEKSAVFQMSPQDYREVSPAVDQVLCGRNRTRVNVNARIRDRAGLSGLVSVGDKLVCTRNNHQAGIVNGSLWRVTEVGPLEWEDQDLRASSLDDPGEPIPFTVPSWSILGEDRPFWEASAEYDLMTYGFCITVHKSQGSEWDAVSVVDESKSFGRDRGRWLYTAITRARKSLYLIGG